MSAVRMPQVDPELWQAALRVASRLRQAGHLAYFAGGAVRDMLLGRPVADVDVVTSARPEESEARFEKTIPVGRQFGVVVVVEGPYQFEVATFRGEGDYRDGRHPGRVVFADPETDARRRDFTVNALFYDPFTDQVLDFVGGRADLQARILRTVGDPYERFAEDRLRMLRAVRFACQLDFAIEARTFAAIKDQAPGITAVSAERIRDELLKILTGPDPARGLDLLLETGLLAVILPEVAAMVGVPQPPEFHPEGDVYTHTRLMFERSGTLHEALALGILLHDVGKPPTFRREDRIRFDGHAEVGARMAEEICRRLRLPNQTVRRVVELVRQHLRFIHVREMRESTLKRFLKQEHFEDHLELHRLDCLASHGDLSNYEFCRRKLAELAAEPPKPPRLVTGHDLIRLGLRPGPVFSALLHRLEDAQLEGAVQTREDALAWLREQPEVQAARTGSDAD
ncbi:MAG: HD domain-containing protein [Acidobacteriota bacterium]